MFIEVEYFAKINSNRPWVKENLEIRTIIVKVSEITLINTHQIKYNQITYKLTDTGSKWLLKVLYESDLFFPIPRSYRRELYHQQSHEEAN